MTRPSNLLACISRYVVSEQWMETGVAHRAQHSVLDLGTVIMTGLM